jgi:hypothetical protein
MLPLARLSSLTKASADLGSTEQSICRMSSLLETIEVTEVPLAHTPPFLAPVETRRLGRALLPITIPAGLSLC